MAREREAWDQFLASGKVEDYLECVRKRDSEESVYRQGETWTRNEENAGTGRSDRSGAYGITGQ